jgi:hypothetical protein
MFPVASQKTLRPRAMPNIPPTHATARWSQAIENRSNSGNRRIIAIRCLIKRQKELLGVKRQLLTVQKYLLNLQRELLTVQNHFLRRQRELLRVKRELLTMQKYFLTMQRELLTMQK